MSLVGHTVGNFQLVNKIGQGGMGAVYLAHHPRIGRQIAIKVMRRQTGDDNDKMAERFFGEARAVNQISHPHIVEIYDCGREGDRLYLTMEYLQGENLSDRIARRPLALGEALHIALQICDALGASHSRGIIHRDIKPENIFLLRRGGDDNFVKVLDFGLARMPPTLKAYATAVDEVFGSPAYMSPEQCEGAGRVDARSDVYALGLVLFEMLTGRMAFEDKTATETMLSQMMRAPQPPSTYNLDVPAALDGIVMRALAKKPSFRYQSMEELANQLRRLTPSSQEQRVERTTPRGPTRPRLAPDQPTELVLVRPRRSRRRRTAMVLIVAGALSALLGGVAARWTSYWPQDTGSGSSTSREQSQHAPQSSSEPSTVAVATKQLERENVAADGAKSPPVASAATKRRHVVRRRKEEVANTDGPAPDAAPVPIVRTSPRDKDGIMVPASFMGADRDVEGQ